MAANNIYLQIDVNSAGAQQNVNALNQALANTGPVVEKSTKQGSTALASFGISIKQVTENASELSDALAGLGVAKAISSMVQLSGDLTRSQAAMRSFTASAAEANEVFEQTRALAAQSPFEFKDLEKGAQRLLGFGIAAQNVPDVLKKITNQVASMGGSIENVNGIVNVFGRIMEKNFVSAMDLLRALPQIAVPATKALGKALEEEFKGQTFDTEATRDAIKKGILSPLQTVRVILESMRGDASSFSDDAARAFKNLGNTIDDVMKKLFGPDGFGPALKKLAEEVGNILAPIGGLIDYLMKLSPETKQTIINVTAMYAAFALLGPAVSIVTKVIGGPLGLAWSIGKLGVSLIAMNPELALAVGLLGALGVAAYKFMPTVKEAADEIWDKTLGPLVAKVKGMFISMGAEGKKFMAEVLKPTTPIETGPLTDTKDLFEKYLLLEQKHADAAQHVLLEALTSPVEAVRLKYATLFRELEEKLLLIKDAGQKKTLRDTLGGAEDAEARAAQFKENKKQLDEYTRYQVERAKGATEAQVAYIEAQDAQDLRNKVRAIDRVTELRIEGAKKVADAEKLNLETQYQEFLAIVQDPKIRAYLEAEHVNVQRMIANQQDEMRQKETAINQKQFDEEQNYRLQGWKKANDIIIEDQKRIYDAFRTQFDELFDAFTNKSKSLGQALGDFFKKFALGEAKELFSSQMAGLATEAAGYGRPEESLARGGRGILGELLRRGMPVRPPLSPPEVQQLLEAAPPTPAGSFPAASSLEGSAHRFDLSTDAYADATIRFAQAVGDFSAATVQTSGEDYRAAPETPTVTNALQAASQATGVPLPLLRAVAQAESNMNPLAVSPAGAMGLMQLMPGTAADMGVTDPFNAGQSAMGGGRYLRWLLSRYRGETSSALAAYNMGPGGYDRLVRWGGTLPLETRNYVTSINRMLSAAAPQFQMYANAPAFDVSTIRQPSAEYAQTPPPPELIGQGPGLPGYLMPNYAVPGGGGGLQGLPIGTSALQGMPPVLAAVLGGALKAGTGTQTAQARINMAQLGEFFGIGGKGVTSLGTILTSKAAGTIAMLGGMALASKGLQQHNALATTAGGGLAGGGFVLTHPELLEQQGPMALPAGIAAGAGLGLFASGFQRGGAAGLGMDVAGGALAGAGIGFMVGGPLGAAIGAGIGAAAGAITGVVRLFVKTEQERIRQQIKQVYGIDISNRQILTQIQQIVDQKYGGSVTIGIRSQDVQDLVRLYALSTGQAAGLPRPMYAATIAQSQAGGLAMQPVYQGGMLVQNPYTGPTTYQYQTAVTAAQGLMAGTSLGVPGAGNTVGNIFMQLNPQQANDLFTGRVVQAVQQNPAAVASANASATRAGDSRVSQAANMIEPLTSLA